jgi:hypothetical protein
MGVHVEGFQAQAPVNIWHWKASRQHQAAFGSAFPSEPAPPDATPPPAPPPAAWNVYGLPPEAAAPAPVEPERGLPSFRAASDAGNVHESEALAGFAVLEANAEGFGTLALQPPDRQDLSGTAVWSSGLWRVVFVRSIRTADAGDVGLSDPRRIPVTFAVWDGSKGDRDGIKLISGWHWLTVLPPGEDRRVAGTGADPPRRALTRKGSP